MNINTFGWRSTELLCLHVPMFVCALACARVKIRTIVILSGWILNLCSLSRSDGGPEIMKQQHVSCEEGGAEEYKLQGHTQGPGAALQICLPSPTDRLFSCSRKCQSCLRTKRSWPLGTSSDWAVPVALFDGENGNHLQPQRVESDSEVSNVLPVKYLPSYRKEKHTLIRVSEPGEE